MSENAYLQSISKASELLQTIGLKAHHNSMLTLPSDYVNRVRDLPYLQQWELHNSHFWYHLKLQDQSLILFKADSFKFMMSPFDKMETSTEFEERITQEWHDEGFSQEEVNCLLEDLDTLYSNYLDTELKHGAYTPLRVDIHPEQYHKVHHSVSHLHIGHDNESRLPIKKIMTPFAFVGFVISTFYPKQWRLLREDSLIPEADFLQLNQTLDSITSRHNDKWCPVEEENRFYLA
ncbi:DUF2290 domain-containing protein [Vibrio kanaloae]|uniref:DUF2290 domain-containing protein n=1 Tax=Vibrio kanaloae TaxID=170673 RepID=UPI0011B830A5|nr:DUF2290 domain-containing protein [Vibrio kanaloae]